MLNYFIVTLDFILVYLLIYRSLLWLRTSHAFNLIKGVIFFALIFFLSYLAGFETLNWILEQLTTVLLIMLVIIFQPELRRFLERIGASPFLLSPSFIQHETQQTKLIRHILNTVDRLSKDKTGALLVLESTSNLHDYAQSGVMMNADLSDDLLVSLFQPGTPTHDGAVIIRKDKILAAGCLLPLTDSPLQDRRLGTRHRAALGLSELSDALIIVISEETGVISLVENCTMNRYLNREALSSRLFNLFQQNQGEGLSFFQNFLLSFKKKKITSPSDAHNKKNERSSK